MEQKSLLQFKIFDLYDTGNINVEDPGLKAVINLKPKLILKSHGRNFQKFGQTKVNIVERLINKFQILNFKFQIPKPPIAWVVNGFRLNVKLLKFQILNFKTSIQTIRLYRREDMSKQHLRPCTRLHRYCPETQLIEQQLPG